MIDLLASREIGGQAIAHPGSRTAGVRVAQPTSPSALPHHGEGGMKRRPSVRGEGPDGRLCGGAGPGGMGDPLPDGPDSRGGTVRMPRSPASIPFTSKLLSGQRRLRCVMPPAAGRSCRPPPRLSRPVPGGADRFPRLTNAPLRSAITPRRPRDRVLRSATTPRRPRDRALRPVTASPSTRDRVLRSATTPRRPRDRSLARSPRPRRLATGCCVRPPRPVGRGDRALRPVRRGSSVQLPATPCSPSGPTPASRRPWRRPRPPR